MRTPGFWRSINPISLSLMPFSWLYALGAYIDRRTTTPQRAALPVISIGNVTAGGAGKTPTALALAPITQSLGHTPHFITRGYGGKALAAHNVTATDTWQQVGDEALLLARTAPTWVGPTRTTSIDAAAKSGATLAICDDAHQHHKLAKTLSFLVFDAPYGIGNGRLMPAGPLREPLSAAIARADAIILVGDDTHHLAARFAPLPVFHATLQPTAEASSLPQGPWLAFAGTGRPTKFFDTCTSLGFTLAATESFPDHHPYTAADLTDLSAKATALGARLITTEKDYVKLPTAQAAAVTTLPVTLTFRDPDGLREFIATRLA